MLLSRLVLEPGRPVSAERLIDDLWGVEAPAGASAALHSLVARLRKAMGGAATLELVAGGYRLPVRAQDSVSVELLKHRRPPFGLTSVDHHRLSRSIAETIESGPCAAGAFIEDDINAGGDIRRISAVNRARRGWTWNCLAIIFSNTASCTTRF
jgi:hypothetical protein